MLDAGCLITCMLSAVVFINIQQPVTGVNQDRWFWFAAFALKTAQCSAATLKKRNKNRIKAKSPDMRIFTILG